MTLGKCCFELFCFAWIWFALLCFALLCFALLCIALISFALRYFALVEFASIGIALLCFAVALLCFAVLWLYLAPQAAPGQIHSTKLPSHCSITDREVSAHAKIPTSRRTQDQVHGNRFMQNGYGHEYAKWILLDTSNLHQWDTWATRTTIIIISMIIIIIASSTYS